MSFPLSRDVRVFRAWKNLVFRVCAVVALLLAGAQGGRSQTLLSYWNFNNDSPAYVAGNPALLGSFSTTAAAYGEAYSTNKLLSNTANGTVYDGSNIYIDFTNLSAGVNNANVNGKTVGGTQTPTNTTFGGYGVFSDSTLNRASTDTTTGGSLIIMNPSGTEVGHYITFSLSSAGYEELTLSYATRLSNGFAGSEVWSYSLNGTDYFSLKSISPTANATFQSESLNLSALSLGALDDQSTFYLRMTISSTTNGGSYAFDNVQLTGVAVPEPGSTVLFLGGVGTVLMAVRVRRGMRC